MTGRAAQRSADLVAGLSVAGLMLPEAVAYAGIAGLPPGRAIFAAIAGGVAYALLGRSRFAVVAPTSSSAAILAAALATLSPMAIDKGLLATAIVAVVGIAFGLMALLRLGSIASFISRPVLRGFAFGLAVTIIVRQLPALLGLDIHVPTFLALLAALATRMGGANPCSLAIGGTALAMLLGLRARTRLPGAPLVLVLGIVLAVVVDLPAHGVALVGSIVLDFAPPRLPHLGFAQWSQIAQLALPLTLILFAESWGTMRALALRHGDSVSADRELGALGGANLLSALVQGMPVGAGFSAGSANEAAGSTTRLSGLVAVLGLGVLVLLAAPAIARIPEPVLAAVVIAALTHALAPAPLVRLFRIDRDQWIALAAALGVIGLGVLDGMLLAVALSLIALLRRWGTPVVSELGQLRGGHDFVDLARHKDAVPAAGVAIYRPNAPLFFGNADRTLAAIADRATQAAGHPVVILSLEESDDLDSSTVEALSDLQRALAARHIALHLARLHDRARAVLVAAGMAGLAATAGFSVADAVEQAGQAKGTADAR